MSTKFKTLCRKPCSFRLGSSEDTSDYVTEFKNTSIPVLLQSYQVAEYGHQVSKFAHHYRLSKHGAYPQKVALPTQGIIIVWLNTYKLDTAFKMFTIAFLGKSDDKWPNLDTYRKMVLPCKKWHHLLTINNVSLNQPLHNWYCTKTIHYCVFQKSYTIHENPIKVSKFAHHVNLIEKWRFHTKSGIIYLCYNDSMIQPLYIWYCTKNIHHGVFYKSVQICPNQTKIDQVHILSRLEYVPSCALKMDMFEIL